MAAAESSPTPGASAAKRKSTISVTVSGNSTLSLTSARTGVEAPPNRAQSRYATV